MLVVLAIYGFTRLRRTTLAAPCLWTALSAFCLAAGALLEPKLEGIGLSALHFSLATTTFCPLMAVLGAKRPQDRGWQWVVATLWIVLVWPAAQAVVLPAGIRVELFVAWKLFLWGLIALGLLNYLPTRHWCAAILVALGQVLLLREHLGFSIAQSPAINQLVATLSFLSAASLIAYRTAAPSLSPNSSPLALQTTSWLNYRNNYGAFWALRVLGRINQSAQQRNWPIQLDWSGFTTTAASNNNQQPATSAQQLSPKQLAEINQAMHSMLRRFAAANDATVDI